MKLNLSVAILAAAAVAFAASPSEAAGKKKSKGSAKTKVTVSKAAPSGYWASGFNNCASAGSRMWFPLAAVGAVGCGIVYAVPVAVESFLWRRV